METNQLRVLVVDDEAAMREVLEARISRWGFEVATADCGSAAERVLATLDPHVVISDLVLPDSTGIQLLERMRAGRPQREIYIITAYGTIDAAVDAMKHGAQDFLTKPLDYVALERRLRKIEAGLFRAPAPRASSAPTLGRLVGGSPAQQEVYAMIRSVAKNDATVLLVGESGTGKELVAEAIHQSSGREGPFVAVNAAAIPDGLTERELLGHELGAFTGATSAQPGLFEQADGGTLFLDEITEMAIGLQAKLLRLLEDGHVRRLGGQASRRCDVRIIAATNRDPSAAVEAGRLRRDLHYRLDVFRINLPPLRARRADLPVLVSHFIKQLNARHSAAVRGLDDQAQRALEHYSFPGNIRELRNMLERGVLLAREGFIQLNHLPLNAEAPASDAEGIVLPNRVTSAQAERILILETLKRTGNNKAETARRLGLDVKTIRNKLKQFASLREDG